MKKVYLFFLIITSFILSSCISYNEEIKINRDLSGTMLAEFIVPNSLLEKDEGKGFKESIQEAKERTKKVEGIELIEAKTEPIGSQTKYKLKLKFNSFKTLKKYFEDNKGKNKKEDSLYNFKLTETKEGIKFERIITPDESKKQKEKTPQDEMAEGFVQMMLANYIWSFKITFPYEVMNANGSVSDDKRTVEWKYDIYTLFSKGAKMEVLLKKPTFIDKILNLFKSILNKFE